MCNVLGEMREDTTFRAVAIAHCLYAAVLLPSKGGDTCKQSMVQIARAMIIVSCYL